MKKSKDSDSENQNSNESESVVQNPKDSESETPKPIDSESKNETATYSKSEEVTEACNTEQESKISTAKIKLKKDIEMALTGDDQKHQTVDQVEKEKIKVSKKIQEEDMKQQMQEDNVSTPNISMDISAAELKLKDEIVKSLTETTDNVKTDTETQTSKEVKDQSVEETPKEKVKTDKEQIYEGKAIIKVVRAKELEKKDVFNKSDPYVIIKYNNEEFKTSVVKNTLNPSWEQDIELDLSRAHKTIRFVLYDWERIGNDDLLGKIDISISDLVQNTANGPKWYKLQNCKSGSILLSIKLISDSNKNLTVDKEINYEEVSDDEFVIVSKDEITDKDSYEPPVKTIEVVDKTTKESEIIPETSQISEVDLDETTNQESKDKKLTEEANLESPSERFEVFENSEDITESKSTVKEMIEEIQFDPSDNNISSECYIQDYVSKTETQILTTAETENIEKKEIDKNEPTFEETVENDGVEIESTTEVYPGLSDSVISYPLSKIKVCIYRFI